MEDEQTPPATQSESQPLTRPGLFLPSGSFLPWEHIVVAVIACAGIGVAVMIVIVPAAGVPIGVGATVSGLLFSIWSWNR